MIPDRLEPVLAELRPLADRFVAAGHSVYLVGGTVRDLLLGRPIAGDYDLTTDARPAEIKRLIDDWADALWTQGERFGTIGARKGDRSYEITTHRAEAYHADSRKPDVAFADAIESDLSRRDFTVNAMALALPDPRLVDPFNGAADLASSTLRTPLSAAESMTRFGCCAPRASLPDTTSTRSTGSRTRSATSGAASRSCRPNASAMSSTSC